MFKFSIKNLLLILLVVVVIALGIFLGKTANSEIEIIEKDFKPQLTEVK